MFDNTPLEENAFIITLLHGNDVLGDEYWIYLAVAVEKYDAYRLAAGLGDFDPEEYGTIITSGEGTHPPAEIREEMVRKYHLSEDFENDLKDFSAHFDE